MRDYRVCKVNARSAYHLALRFCKMIHGYECSFLGSIIEIAEKENT